MGTTATAATAATAATTSLPDRSIAGKLSIAGSGSAIVLAGLPTDDPSLVKNRRRAESELDGGRLSRRLASVHDRLMACGEHSVLVVLQGLDGSGKSGTIKHVGRLLNPVGMSVASFKEPDAKEEHEHFLNRIRRQLPEPGCITFFDRSHYEDAIIPYADGELDDAALAVRIAEIEAFERELLDAGTAVLKVLLHLSYEEQRERFLRRLRRADKRWKFSDSDLETRDRWPTMQLAYGEVIGRSSFECAPWFVVPADRKWYRNWTVATLLADHLETLGCEYPDLEADPKAARKRLEAPR